MPLRRLAKGAALAAMLAAGAAHAQDASLKLSLDEAVARAEKASPVVMRARGDRAVVAAQKVGAGVLLPYNPAVSGAFGHRRDTSAQPPGSPLSQGFEWSARLEQTIEIGGQRGARLREAARAIDVADARVRSAVIETRARARAAYLAGLLTQRFVDLTRRREQLAERVLVSAQARTQAGAASDVELKLAEIELGRLRHERIEAEVAARTALNDLKLVTGVPMGAELVLTTELAPPAIVDATLQALLDRAMARRADLLALERTQSQLDAQILRLRRELIPSPTLFFDAQQQQPGQTYFGGGVGFAIPVWQRNQGPIAIARAEKERTAAEQEILAREIATEVVNVYRALAARRQEVELLEKRVLPAAEANLDLVTQGWRAGKFDLFRVIQASREVGEAQRRALEVLGGLWQATIELGRATGVS